MTELLEQQLITLSRQLDVDVGDRLVADVMRRIGNPSSAAEPPKGALPVTRLVTRRRLTVCAFAVAAAIVAVIAIPNSRHAVAHWFGIGSTRIERTPASVPAVPATTVAASSAGTNGTDGSSSVPEKTAEPAPTTVPVTFPVDLDLGQPISILEARELTGLPVPASDLLGTPSGVYVVIPPPAGQVVVVYPASATVPASPVAGVGALLSAVSGRLDDALFTKIAGMGTSVESLSITVASGSTVPAVWLEGEPHDYAMVDADGTVLFDSLRLATNALLWMEDGVVFRLEADVSREQAIDIASSVVAA